MFDGPVGAMRRGRLRHAISSGAAVLVLAGVVSEPAAAQSCADTGPTTVTCTYASGNHEFTPPAGVTSVRVVAVGGRGGHTADGSDPTPVIPGGSGGRAAGTLAVTPGVPLSVRVGANGGNGTTFGPKPGGSGGGASGCSGGGGASDVRTSPTMLSSRLLVAGGGGGAGCHDITPDGGAGGGAGTAGGMKGSGGGGGGGGTTTAGGAGGAGEAGAAFLIPPGGNGAPGTFGGGGAGGGPATAFDGGPGGGGGGGYFGGGGGGGGGVFDGRGGGGGGGSNFAHPSVADATLGLAGAGDAPIITISYATAPVPAPAAAVNPASVDFGSQAVGSQSASQIVTLSSSGTAPLVVSGVSISGTNAADFEKVSDSCSGQSLAPNASCAVSVRFTPGAAGSRSASVQFADNAANSPQSVGLSGTGTETPAAAVSPGNVEFGTQVIGAPSAPQTVTLSSTGSAPLVVSVVTVAGANAGDFATSNDTCSGQTLAPNSSCTVDVRFTPGAAGARSASLRFADNAADSPQSVALSGTGRQRVADLVTSLTATPNPVKAGGTITYTINARNNGPEAADQARLSDTLATNTQFTSLAAPAGWSCTVPPVGNTGTIVCTNPSLPSGTTAMFTLKVKVIASPKTTASNTVKVDSQSTDPNPQNNEATATTSIKGGR